MPEGFFDCEESEALDECSFDLAVVDGWVDGAADVHFDVCTSAGPVSREGVDFDFCAGYALGEVEEHLAGVGAPYVADVRGFVCKEDKSAFLRHAMRERISSGSGLTESVG